MTIREYVPLKELTTLRVGGPARFVIDCKNEADVLEALAFAKAQNLPWCMLGEGSNMLASDEGFGGVIIRIGVNELTIEERDDVSLLTAESGMHWDTFVTTAAEKGLWGIENLAGIPGTVGASPVQNIGAYGSEVKDTLYSVRVLDTKNGEIRVMDAAACAFGYRDSIFKHDSSLVILSVTFALTKDGMPSIAYKDLANAAAEGIDLSTPSAIGEAVRAIRARKFPDLSIHGTAGSFFKNPVISGEHFSSLKEAHPDMPGYETEQGVKVPLAFVLDKILELRGYAEGKVSLFANQPLVLVTEDGATASDVDMFANAIVARVHEKTGITVEREVRSLQ